jgi:hypothetical protein
MNTGVFYLGPCRKASLLRLLRLVRMEVAVHARATRGGTTRSEILSWSKWVIFSRHP